MKTQHLLKTVGLCLFLSPFVLSGQNQHTIWHESFNTSCASNCLATAYTSSNGSWTTATIGTQGGQANKWYISKSELGATNGICANGSTSGSNSTGASLHVSATNLGGIVGVLGTLPVLGNLLSGISEDQGGAQYFTGMPSGLGALVDGLLALLSGGTDATTNSRVMSPIIDLTGRRNMTLTFNYLAGGDNNDKATLVYYDGANWVKLADMAQSTTCNTSKREWKSYSVVLPTNAENNPNFQLGFTWVNNNDANGGGSAYGFAVDDIKITVAEVSASMNSNGNAGLDSTMCSADTLFFQDQSTGDIISWNWTISGATTATFAEAVPAPFVLNPGLNYIRLDISNGFETDFLLDTVEVFLSPSLSVTSTAEYSVGILGTAIATVSGGVSPFTYSWNTNPIQTSDTAVGLTQGTYEVTVIDSNGCKAIKEIDVNWIDGAPGDTLSTLDPSMFLRVFPNPSFNFVTVQVENYEVSKIGLFSIHGQQIKVITNTATTNIISLEEIPSGIYLIQIHLNNGQSLVHKLVKN